MPYLSRADERASQKRKIAKRQVRNDEANADIPCAKCGGQFPPVCMDGHHRDPHTKSKKRFQQMGLIAFLQGTRGKPKWSRPRCDPGGRGFESLTPLRL